MCGMVGLGAMNVINKWDIGFGNKLCLQEVGCGKWDVWDVELGVDQDAKQSLSEQ